MEEVTMKRVARASLEEAILGKLREFVNGGASGINFSALIDVPELTTLSRALSAQTNTVTVTLGAAVTMLDAVPLPQFIEVPESAEVQS